MAGVQLGAYTPDVSVAQLKMSTKLSSTNPLVQAVVTGFNAQDQKSVSLGLRWDFAKNAELKVQFDRVLNGTRATEFLINPPPVFVPGAMAPCTW